MRTRIGIAFVALALGLAVWAVWDERSGLGHGLHRMPAGDLAGSVALAFGAVGATFMVWRAVLRGFGVDLPLPDAARVYFVGQVGKYVPGSVWPVLAQMELGHSYQVPRHRSATASVLTILLSLLSGLLAALVTLPFVAGSTPYLWAFLAAPVLLVLLHPRVLNRVLDRLLRLAGRPPLDRPLTGRAMAGALAWAFASWILFGLQIWFLATRLGAPAGKTAVLAVGGFAFAWCVGFLVVFAPAGAGIREVLLVATLGPVLGAGSATAVALVSRAAMTAGDLLTAGAAAGFTRSSAAAAARQAPPEPGPGPAGEPPS